MKEKDLSCPVGLLVLGRLITLKVDRTTCMLLEQRVHCMRDNLDVLSVTPRSPNTYLVTYSYFLIVFFDLLPIFVLYYELFI